MSEAYVTMTPDLLDAVRHPNGTGMSEVTKDVASRLDRGEYRILVTFGTAESIWVIRNDGSLRMPGNMPRQRRNNILKIAKEVL